ncbi:MAG TPA: hypothetical protein VGI81_14620 [Tepidisphaeraceae bacterium]|jgi:hypothetical protein
MFRRLCIATAFLLAGSAALALADDAKSQPAASVDSPKAALRSQDAAARSGNVGADMAFYQAEGDQQQKLARTLAEGDLAVARLEKAVAQRFGKDLAAQAVRAAGTEDVAAVDAAGEKIDDDHATIQFRDQQSAVPMVRVDGKWKVSLSEWTQGASPAQVDHLIESLGKLAAGINHIADLVEHEKFRSGEGARDHVQELHDSLFGANSH